MLFLKSSPTKQNNKATAKQKPTINWVFSSPILFLLAINLAVGILTFRDFGLSWDEPLFYNYADSIRTAYTPLAFSPGFNFEQVYGKSPEDHKIYGPAYLLLAQPVELTIVKLFNTDMASAWHLVNFLTFQLGLLAFYVFIRRWFKPWPAVMTTVFLAWQPVYWGHAFINSKDIPFMVFFLCSMVSGFSFVDSLDQKGSTYWVKLIFSAVLLGLASATRVIGPLAGVLVLIYFALKKQWRSFPLVIFYGLIAILIMFLCWPYLWADPINRLLEVFKHMSNNPTELSVLFDGQIFHANEMPRRYLPQIMWLTLTEPTWILFSIGCLVTIFKIWKNELDWRLPTVVIALFIFMSAYLLYNKPSVYDGFRHFFFITPPIFVMIGFSIQWAWDRLKPQIWSVLMLILLIPGLVGIIQLHPYEYAYYNSITGGVGGAFRTYETEYWLTCYKEAIHWAEQNFPNYNLHIQREFPLAEYYGNNMNLKDLSKETEQDLKPGDLLLFHTRANLDIRSNYRKIPTLHVIGRNSAQFCIIKQYK